MQLPKPCRVCTQIQHETAGVPQPGRMLVGAAALLPATRTCPTASCRSPHAAAEEDADQCEHPSCRQRGRSRPISALGCPAASPLAAVLTNLHRPPPDAPRPPSLLPAAPLPCPVGSSTPRQRPTNQGPPQHPPHPNQRPHHPCGSPSVCQWCNQVPPTVSAALSSGRCSCWLAPLQQ